MTGTESWVFNNNGCLSRVNRAAGYIDSCWKLYYLSNPPNTGKDYWSLEFWGTAWGSGWPYGMGWAYVKTVHNTSGSAMSWVDWSPRGTINAGGCVNTSLSVSGILALSYGITVCETMTPTKGTAGGDFGSVWQCTGCFVNVSGQAREASLMEEISVPKGGRPIWNLYTDLGG